MRKPNINALIKDALVERFEGVVINEMNETRKNHEQINIKIDEQSNEIKLIKNELNLIRRDQQNKFDKFYLESVDDKKLLNSSCNEDKSKIQNAVLELKKHIQESKEFQDKFISKEQFEDHEKSTKKIVSNLSVAVHDEHKKLIDFVTKLNINSSVSFIEFAEAQGKIIEKLSLEIDGYKKKITEYTVSHDGLIREILVLKKTQNYLEKNIENIYTQISRLKA